MWIGICEDNDKYRIRLENEVRSIAQSIDRVTAYSNGFDLLDDIGASPYPMDILLLDIEVPGLNGIETARELQAISPDTQIIILTNHKDYALKSFEIRPSNYLIKPIDKIRLKAEIDRARLIAGEDIGETLRIHSKDTVAFIPLKDILYIECFGHTLYIYTASNHYKFIHQLGRLEEALSGKGFCRTHKSYLVNLRHVESIDRKSKTALLVNGQTVTVGELRITDVLAEYSRF